MTDELSCLDACCLQIQLFSLFAILYVSVKKITRLYGNPANFIKMIGGTTCQKN